MAVTALTSVKSILVPVDGSDAAYQALGLAADIAKRAHARLHLLYVIEVPRSMALDMPIDAELQRAERVLDRAEKLASECGVEVAGDLVQARQAGHAVVDEAVERGVDTIVIGVGYDRPYGEYALGDFAEYVLKHAPAQVWIIRSAEPSAGR
jgi:nucleotide-binding universal stress UspA family protein